MILVIGRRQRCSAVDGKGRQAWAHGYLRDPRHEMTDLTHPLSHPRVRLHGVRSPRVFARGECRNRRWSKGAKARQMWSGCHKKWHSNSPCFVRKYFVREIRFEMHKNHFDGIPLISTLEVRHGDMPAPISEWFFRGNRRLTIGICRCWVPCLPCLALLCATLRRPRPAVSKNSTGTEHRALLSA